MVAVPAGVQYWPVPPGHLPRKVKILAGVTGHQNNCFTVKGIWSEEHIIVVDQKQKWTECVHVPSKGYLARWLSDEFIFVIIFRTVCDETTTVGI